MCRCCRGPACERRLTRSDLRRLERDLWAERTSFRSPRRNGNVGGQVRRFLDLFASVLNRPVRQSFAWVSRWTRISPKVNERDLFDLRTKRTQVHRRPERASYDRAVIYPILDTALYCHIGFTLENQPYVVPTIHTRIDDSLYIHGSAASRMLRVAAQGVKVCVTVTLLDGLVLARSAFHHSINYRSVVILGTATEITNQAEKLSALKSMVEHIVLGRWNDVRQPTEKELRATKVLRITIEEASAKIRTGPPLDDEEDYMLPNWAGEIPIRTAVSAPIPDPRLRTDIRIPDYLMSLSADETKPL